MKRRDLDGYKKKDKETTSYRTSEYKGVGRPKKTDYIKMVRLIDGEVEYQIEE